MTASLEQRKQQYSKQLAAHTLRQWNAVRQHSSPVDKAKPMNHTGLATPPDTDHTDQNEAPGAGDRGKGAPQRQNVNSRKGVHSIDYATRKAYDNRQ